MVGEAESWRTTILVNNIHCASCVAYIRELLRGFNVTSFNINTLSQEVDLDHAPSVSIRDLCLALADAAFEVNSAFTINHKGSRIFELKGDDDLEGWWTTATRDALGHSPSKSRTARSSCLSLPLNSQRFKHLENCEACRQQTSNTVEKPATPLSARRKRWRTSDLEMGLCKQEEEPVTKNEHPSLPAEPETGAEDKTAQQQQRAVLSIGGMTCASCTTSASNALGELDFVQNVTVSLMTNSAEIIYNGSQDLTTRLVEAIEDVGFEATVAETVPLVPASRDAKPKTLNGAMAKLELSIGGMTSTSCTRSIDRGLRQLPFVEDVVVTLTTNSARIICSGFENERAIVEMVEDLGFNCKVESKTPVDTMNHEAEKDESRQRTVQVKVDGMFCEHCPLRISEALTAQFGNSITINSVPSQASPIISLTYRAAPPTFTIRQIINTIDDIHEAFSSHIYHPPSLEERSQAMQRREHWRILIRLFLCFVLAIPTLLIGVIWMSVVPASNHIRTFLMQPVWTGNVTRAEWALLIMATPVYFFSADVFHIRALKEIRALWGRKSKVPVLRRFYRFGSMNLLISAGTSIAYISSLALLILGAKSHKSSHSSTYFDSVVFLTFFILLGRYLESFSKSKSGDIVAMLGKLRPNEVTLVHYEEKTSSKGANRASDSAIERELDAQSMSRSLKGSMNKQIIQKISADLLEAGDVIIVPRGFSPPADGIILSLTAKIDESSLTGESHIIKKVKDDQIFAGSINVGDPIIIKITDLGGKSMLDHIVQVVREGQAKRAPVERIVDSVTAYFVPIITALAVMTFIIWISLGYSGELSSKYLAGQQGGWAFWSLEFAIAVFVVACPCGIGLAAPTALFVGGGLAVKHGILVRGGGEAFQEASKVDVVAFDKTGTLTEGGDLKVTDHEIVCDGVQREVVWSIARALEEPSNHPLAKAICEFAKEQNPQIGVATKTISEVPGLGLRGTFEVQKRSSDDPTTYEAALGSEALIASLLPTSPTSHSYYTTSTLSTWKSHSKSIAILALRRLSPSSTSNQIPSEDTVKINNHPWKPALLLASSDPLRPSAQRTITALKDRGIQVYMLTGDNPTTAAAVASSLSIPLDHIFAGVLPAEKADKIRWLQDHGPKCRSSSSRSPLIKFLIRAFRSFLPERQQRNDKKCIVAFIGDGINDAPALACAPVSISLASASSIAMTSSSFILLTSSLSSIITLLSISERVFRRVKWNFAWAGVYNLVLVPVAAGALFWVKEGGWRLGPVWAAGAMALSSVSVGLSSLALRWEGGWMWWRKNRKGDGMGETQEN